MHAILFGLVFAATEKSVSPCLNRMRVMASNHLEGKRLEHVKKVEQYCSLLNALPVVSMMETLVKDAKMDQGPYSTEAREVSQMMVFAHRSTMSQFAANPTTLLDMIQVIPKDYLLAHTAEDIANCLQTSYLECRAVDANDMQTMKFMTLEHFTMKVFLSIVDSIKKVVKHLAADSKTKTPSDATPAAPSTPPTPTSVQQKGNPDIDDAKPPVIVKAH